MPRRKVVTSADVVVVVVDASTQSTQTTESERTTIIRRNLTTRFSELSSTNDPMTTIGDQSPIESATKATQEFSFATIGSRIVTTAEAVSEISGKSKNKFVQLSL